MNSGRSSTAPTLAEKLTKLFDTVRRADGRRYTYEEVAGFVRERAGVRCDRAYISALVKGAKDNPTMKILDAVAEFFDVSPAYFFDDEKSREITAQLDMLAVLRDSEVRQIAMRELLDLTPSDIPVVTELIRSLKKRDTPTPGND